MFYTKVDELPEKKKTKKKLRVFLDEFMSENIKMAKVHVKEDDYKHPRYAYTSLLESARNGGYPIDVVMVNGETFLVRRDME